MISFYSWTQVDKFFHAWRSAGFRIVGHIVFRKQYTSKARFLKYQHEQAYLLAKGNPSLPENPISDVIDMPYSGNKLHPTQKSVGALKPLIDAEISRLQQAREILEGTNPSVRLGPGRPRTKNPVAAGKPKRRLSADARARIAAAQKARWVKVKKTAKS